MAVSTKSPLAAPPVPPAPAVEAPQQAQPVQTSPGEESTLGDHLAFALWLSCAALLAFILLKDLVLALLP